MASWVPQSISAAAGAYIGQKINEYYVSPYIAGYRKKKYIPAGKMPYKKQPAQKKGTKKTAHHNRPKYNIYKQPQSEGYVVALKDITYLHNTDATKSGLIKPLDIVSFEGFQRHFQLYNHFRLEKMKVEFISDKPGIVMSFVQMDDVTPVTTMATFERQAGHGLYLHRAGQGDSKKTSRTLDLMNTSTYHDFISTNGVSTTLGAAPYQTSIKFAMFNAASTNLVIVKTILVRFHGTRDTISLDES